MKQQDVIEADYEVVEPRRRLPWGFVVCATIEATLALGGLDGAEA